MTSANKRNPYLFVSILALYKMALSTIQNLHIKGLVWGKKDLFCILNQLYLLNYEVKIFPTTEKSSILYAQKLYSFKTTFLYIFTFKSHSNPRHSE